jgi:hypothetical protein
MFISFHLLVLQEESKRVAAQRIFRAQLKQMAHKSVLESSSHQRVPEPNSNIAKGFKAYPTNMISQGKSTQFSSTGTSITVGATASDFARDTIKPPQQTLDDNIDVDWQDGYEGLHSKDLLSDDGDDGDGDDGSDAADQDGMKWSLPENPDDLNSEVLSSLPSHLRKSLIEEARRKQRVSSRANYLPVAGNPALYSQTQLSNFLNSRCVLCTEIEHPSIFDSIFFFLYTAS